MQLRIFKFFFPLLIAFLLGACASSPDRHPQDPWEGFNRTMYGFNDGVDTFLLKPVAKSYRFITPDIVETGVSNFFSNLLEVRNVVNAGLQGKGKKTLKYSGRFLVNSTIGVLGIFDVARYMGLEKTDGEDFGQTLGAWGVGSGPYVVWPFLGPSTLRDTVGIPADTYVNPVTYIDHVPTRNTTIGTRLISDRADLLDAEKLITGDKYLFIREAFLQRREYLVKDGSVEDEFGADLESDDF